MKYSPDYIANLQPYVAGKTIAEVKKAYNPERIAKLASNENRLGCSPNVHSAVSEAMKVVQDYPDPASMQLRQELAEFYKQDVSRIVCASGSEGVMTLFTRAFIQEGDHVITAGATFIGFLVLANIQGANLQRIPLTEDFRFDVKAIADAVTNKTKVVYIANPNNPTGTIISETEYEWLLNNIPAHVIVIMDEAYFEYSQSFEEFPDSLVGQPENVIVFRTFSKAYGLAGLRVGYAIGDEKWISIMTKIKPPFDPSVVAQFAGIAALKDRDFLQKGLEIVESGRMRLYQFLDTMNLKYVPSYSNSVMLVFDSTLKAEEFTQNMLERGVILRRLPGFGLPNCVRVTIGLPDEMEFFEKHCAEVVEA